MEVKSTLDLTAFVQLLVTRIQTKYGQRRLIRYLSMPSFTNRLIHTAFCNGGTAIVSLDDEEAVDYSFLLWGSMPTLTDDEFASVAQEEYHAFVISPLILVTLIENKQYYEKQYRKHNKSQS